MSGWRAAAVLALLAIAVGAWFACSSHERGDEPAPANSSGAAPPHASRAVPAPRVVPRRRTTEPLPGAKTAEAAGHVIRGRTVLRDGSPASGARVRAWSVKRMWAGGPGEIGEERVTGDDGAFTVAGAETGDQVVIYAVLAGHHTAFPPTPVMIASPTTDVTIRFGEGGVLTGRVVGPMGKPAGHVEVRLRPTERLAHTRDSGDWRLWAERDVWEFYAATTSTDADGRYRFDGVPLPRNGVPQTRVPVATVAGKDWAGEDVAFETDGQEIERDIVIGEKPWTDTPLPEPPKPVERSVSGTVVRPDGTPLAGAQVTYLEFAGPGSTSWLGTTSKADGSFAFEERTVKPATRLEVRAAAKGFRTFRGAPPDDGAMTIRLEPSDHAPLPGRIRGKARAAQDAPITGPLQVTAVDELYRVHHLWTWADSDGSFVLEGLAPGEWRVFLLWSETWQDVTVAEGGEARANLAVHLTAAELAPEPWTKEKAAEREHMQLEVQLESETEQRQGARPRSSSQEGKVEAAVRRLSELDASLRASLPVREVLVGGLPTAAGCVVVAKDGSREWRSAARDGVARFVGLSVEKWTFTLVRPGADDVTQEAEVVAGDGAQTIAFAAR